MDDCLVGELVVPGGGLDELALEVQQPALANLVDDLKVLIFGLGLELGGPSNVRPSCHLEGDFHSTTT